MILFVPPWFWADETHLSHAINPPCCGKKGGGHKNGARK